MGMYIFISEEDRISKRKVDDKEVNDNFQAALLCDPSLMIEEHKKHKKKLFKNEYVQTDIWWDIYHEAPAYNGSAYQARYQFSGSGKKEVVLAYLHGIVNGVTHQDNRFMCQIALHKGLYKK